MARAHVELQEIQDEEAARITEADANRVGREFNFLRTRQNRAHPDMQHEEAGALAKDVGQAG